MAMCDDRELEYFGPSFLYCSACEESRAWTYFGSVTCASVRQFLCNRFGSALRWCGSNELYDALALATMQHGWICLECEAAASRGRLSLASAASNAAVSDSEWLGLQERNSIVLQLDTPC